MYKIHHIDLSSNQTNDYQRHILEAFPTIGYQPSNRDLHIALSFNDTFVCGITIERIGSICLDDSVTKLWEPKVDFKAVKLKRLWNSPSQSGSSIFKVFQEVLNIIDSDDFVYGILSFSIPFAQNNKDKFIKNIGMLSPKFPIEDYTELAIDSKIVKGTGENLMDLYTLLGGVPLAEMSVFKEEKTAKAILGIKMNTFSQHSFIKDNAKINT